MNGRGYPSTGRELEILGLSKRRWITDRGVEAEGEGEGENEEGDFSKSVGKDGIQSMKAVRLCIWRADAAQIKPRHADPGLEFVR